MVDDLLGQRARVGLGLLGQYHGGIRGKVAMRGIAGRFDRDIAAGGIRGKHAFQFEGVEDRIDPGGESRVKCLHFSHGARLAYRRKMARRHGGAPLTAWRCSATALR